MIRLAPLFAASSLALLLVACGGGGGGGGIASTPTPTPSPTPTPTPTPGSGQPPLPSGPLGLTGGPFVTPGAHFDGITGNWPNYASETITTGSDVVSISYSATDNVYTLTLPAYGTGKLVPTSGNGGYINDKAWSDLEAVNYDLVTPAGKQPVIVTMRYPGDKDPYPFNLSYTSLGSWNSLSSASPQRAGVFAYGIPTDTATMPLSGSATYSALVVGQTRTNNYVGGGAILQFEFGAGTLTGSMTVETTDGWDPVPLGTFTFKDTIFSAGSTSFGGKLTVPGSTDLGSFAGQFTGPAAAELLAHFQSPAYNPFLKQWDEIAGVWVGKKQ